VGAFSDVARMCAFISFILGDLLLIELYQTTTNSVHIAVIHMFATNPIQSVVFVWILEGYEGHVLDRYVLAKTLVYSVGKKCA
jgi:hypothetical protein